MVLVRVFYGTIICVHYRDNIIYYISVSRVKAYETIFFESNKKSTVIRRLWR